MALQIRGDQLKGIKNDSIAAVDANHDGIDLAKLNLTQGATFSGALVLSNDNEHSGILSVSNTTDSTSHTDGSLIVSGGVGIAKKLFVNSDADISGSLVVDGDVTLGSDTNDTITIKGNLQVDGTTTTINSTELTVDDLNIIVASGAANSAAANGAGLTIDTGEASEGDNPQFTWYSVGGTERFELNKAIKFEGAVTVDNNMTLSSNRSLQMTNGSGSTTINLSGTDGSITSASLSCSGNIATSGGSVSGVSISDGTASMSGGNLTSLNSVTSSSFQNAASSATFSVSSAGAVSAASLTSSGAIQFGSLSDGSVSLGGFVPSSVGAATFISSHDNDTSIPTSAMIQDYVDYKFQNTSLSGDVTGDLTGDIKNSDGTLVLDNGSDTVGLVIYSGDGTQDVFSAGTDGSDAYFEGDIRKEDNTVLVDIDDANGVYFKGKVSDITNHEITQLSDVSISANGLGVRDMLMVNSSNEIENVYEVIKYVSVDMTAGKGESQAVSLDVDRNADYESIAMVFLNGQKLRYGADSSTNDFYFSAAGTITFQASTLASGDELEIRYIVAS